MLGHLDNVMTEEDTDLTELINLGLQKLVLSGNGLLLLR